MKTLAPPARGILALLWSPPILGFMIGTTATLAILGLRSGGYLEAWELRTYNWALKTQPASASPEAKIVLVGITEEDIQALGSWPLTDAVMTQVLETLLQYQPRVIGVDIYRNLPVPPGHEMLESVLTTHPNIIMVTKFGSGTLAKVPPPPILKGTDQVAFNDLLLDEDGIVRRGLLFMDDGQQIDHSFSLRLALKYLQAEGISPQPDPSTPEYLRLGPTTFRPLNSNDGGYVGADARGYQFLLDFGGTPTPLPSYSVSALLSGQVKSQNIRDKIVLIGVMAESVPDLFHTPYSTGLGTEERGTYGVLVHAHMVSQLLRAALQGQAPRHTMSEQQEVLWILCWGLMGSAIGVVSRSTWRFAAFGVGGLAVLILLAYVAFVKGWWIPLVPPALAWVLSAALITAAIAGQEKRDRAQLMQLFARHVSPEVAETIWRQREHFWDGGRPRSQLVTITVLFTDLEGFTPISEKMDPQALMDWTNTYIDTMAKVIMEHQGVVDDYFGDAIKANFGVPLPRTTDAEIGQDAKNAVACALGMEQEMRRLNRLWQELNLPSARMRIGIFTGPAVAGSLGSAERLKYTTLGDSVNTAARLESLDKEALDSQVGDSPCRILIGESTVCYIGADFQTQRFGEVALEGKGQKITVYRLIGRANHDAVHLMQGA